MPEPAEVDRSTAGYQLVVKKNQKSYTKNNIYVVYCKQKLHVYHSYPAELFAIFVTFTAGLRCDSLETAGSSWSPSLGAVYPLGSHLLLRAFVGRGFTAPSIGAAVTNEAMGYKGNPDLGVEKVLSCQGGVEGDVPGLFWYKVTIFNHEVSHGLTVELLDDEHWTIVNKDKIRRQGLEVDAQSVAFYGLALEGGATLIDAENRTSGNENLMFADSTYRIGLSYTGGRGLRVLLHLHRTHWSTSTDNHPAADPIVDLHVSQAIPVAGLQLELFGSAHNIFEADQYFSFDYPNPGRWLEAGLRLNF